MVAAGKLDEAIDALNDYAADPRNASRNLTELNAYLARLSQEQADTLAYLDAMKSELAEGRLASARAHLSAARKLHPSYAPTVEAGSLMQEAERAGQ
jgi:hypothetical protein